MENPDFCVIYFMDEALKKILIQVKFFENVYLPDSILNVAKKQQINKI